MWRGVPQSRTHANSRVRSVTTYAITPKMPSAASSNAPAGKPESKVTVRRWRASCPDTASVRAPGRCGTCDRNVRVDGADHAWKDRQQSVRIAARANPRRSCAPKDISVVRDVDLGGGLVLQARVRTSLTTRYLDEKALSEIARACADLNSVMYVRRDSAWPIAPGEASL